MNDLMNLPSLILERLEENELILDFSRFDLTD